MRDEAVPKGEGSHAVDRPGQPFCGAGEAGQDPTASGISNTIADAVGAHERASCLATAAEGVDRRLIEVDGTVREMRDAIESEKQRGGAEPADDDRGLLKS